MEEEEIIRWPYTVIKGKLAEWKKGDTKIVWLSDLEVWDYALLLEHKRQANEALKAIERRHAIS